VAYLITTVLAALTLGNLGDPPPEGPTNVLQQLPEAPPALVGFALAGGVCLAVGDVAMQYAVAFLGLAVGPSLLNALALIVGVRTRDFLQCRGWVQRAAWLRGCGLLAPSDGLLRI